MTRLSAVIALTLAAPASASTVDVDIYEGDSNVMWTADGFRPVDGIDTHEAKYSCPRVGLSWKDMAADRVMRETRCPVPPDAGWQWVAPLGLAPAPVVWHRAASYGSTGWFHGGGGGCGCGGHTTTHKPPETPPAPIPLPGALGAMLAALGGLVMMRRNGT